MGIHKTAIVHASAKIGKDVIIDPYAVIKEGVTIGDRSHIHSHSVIEFTEMGEENQIYPYAAIGLPAQHLQYKGEPSKVVMGHRNTIREGVTIHRGTPFDQNITRIGDECYLMAQSHLAHDCVLHNRVIIANHTQIAGHVHIHNDAFLSTMIGIHQWVHVGRGVMISGGSMVGMDVAPFCNVQGDRATIRGLNLVGMKRMGMKLGDTRLIKAAYKTFFMSGLKVDEALKHSDLNIDNPYVSSFREFIEKASQSKRGILKTEGSSVKEGAPTA